MITRQHAPHPGSRLVLRLLFALAVVLGSFLAVAAPARAGEPAPEQAIANYEIDFLQDMIDHHHMAVMTGEMCVEKAVHEELRALCQEIVAAQSQEIATMQSWLQSWYGVSYEHEMQNGHMQRMHKLHELSGEEFEIAFMEMMIRHHKMAVREGERCVDRAYHDELVTMCEGIIATQTEEIATMRAWLCEWYGVCKGS